jgi:hypothetical protein
VGTHGASPNVATGNGDGTDENKQAMNIRIDPDLVEALEVIRDAEGIPVSEQIRRGIRLWLDQKGAAQRTTRRTSSTRARGKRA